MISSTKQKSQQNKTKQKQLNTCLRKTLKSSTLDSITKQSLDSNKITKPTMSSLTANLCAAAAAASAGKTSTTGKSPMEGVVVNSIIYSKPSFCSIVVDLGGGSAKGEIPPITKHKISCSDKLFGNNGFIPTAMDIKTNPLGFASACLAGFASAALTPPSLAPQAKTAQKDAQLYRMCTTMNGSIHHQISDICDNLLAMAQFIGVANDHDDDDDDDESLIEFAYDNEHYEEDEEDESDDEDDDDDETDDEDVEYENDDDDYLDADTDIINFNYECPTMHAPKLNCDKRKKVRFNTKPIVHVMHTWNYAYRAARKGQWEMFARDRERFKLRVQRAATMLNPILQSEHRQKIYEKRFITNNNNDVDQKNSHQKLKAAVEVKFEKANPAVENTNKVENINTITESKKSYQKKKRKKKRFCKMGNKHYF